MCALPLRLDNHHLLSVSKTTARLVQLKRLGVDHGHARLRRKGGAGLGGPPSKPGWLTRAMRG